MMKPIIKAPATWKDKLWATREVFRVNHQLKRYTLDDIIAEIQNISVVSNALPEEDMHIHRLDGLMAGLNFGFGFDSSGRKCLAYSYTLARMARCIGIPARLVIGVITKPFFSHAWVEYQHKVINDDPLLRQKLSVIVEI